MSTANGSTNGSTNGHATDEAIDVLYSFFPGAVPAPAPCPEAAFSCTMEGCIDGHKTLLTARGMTAAEFKANLEAIKGVLDPVPQPAPQAASQGQDGWCAVHQTTMNWNTGKAGRQGWWSHRTDAGWCQGK
jgi:hypothetical protein